MGARLLQDVMVVALLMLAAAMSASPSHDLLSDRMMSSSGSTKGASRWRRSHNANKNNNNNNNNNNSERFKSDSLDSNGRHQQPQHQTQYVAECNMPTTQGYFRMRSYEYTSSTQRLEPIVMISGDLKIKENVLVRVHDQCFTSEVFGSMRCDCRDQLKESLRLIQKEGGVVIYLQQEGRGIGLANKIAAYALQDEGMDTVDANINLGFEDEGREYFAVPDILRDLGIQSIHLLTNNPYKIERLSQLGVTITERRPIQIPSNPYNQRYLRSKKDRMRHILTDDILTSDHEGEIPTMRYLHRGDRLPHTVGDTVESEAPQQQQQSRADSRDVNHGVPEHVKLFGGSTIGTHNATAGTEHAYEYAAGDSHDCYAFGKRSVEDAIFAVRQGRVVIVVDDADRENEGDFIMAAEMATPDAIGFIIRYSSGVICISLEGDRLDALQLPPMVVDNECPKQTAYSVSADYKHGTSTGISAFDRALTFRKLVDPSATADDFQRPGHVFPLRYKPGGVLSREGHTEASLDLSRLAGLRPGAILCEIVRDDGSMMRLAELEVFAREQGLVITSVQDIIAYRREIERRA